MSVVVDSVEPCPGRQRSAWESIGQIEALKERFTVDRPCPGLAWFELRTAATGGRAVRLCAACAATALRQLRQAGATPYVLSVELRCPVCGHVGSHTESGRELCSRCRHVHRVPK